MLEGAGPPTLSAASGSTRDLWADNPNNPERLYTGAAVYQLPPAGGSSTVVGGRDVAPPEPAAAIVSSVLDIATFVGLGLGN